MDNSVLLNMLSTLMSSPKKPEESYTTPSHSKDLDYMYPYGDFPIKYTKSYQEYQRISRNNILYPSQYQTSNAESIQPDSTTTDSSNTPNTSISMSSIMPLIQSLLSGKKNSSEDILNNILPLLFKDSPSITPLLSLIKSSSTAHKPSVNTLNTDKVDIDSLQIIN